MRGCWRGSGRLVQEALTIFKAMLELSRSKATAAIDKEPAPETTTCLNCGTNLQGLWCHHCGQKKQQARLTLNMLLAQVYKGITNLENGLWFTLVSLLKSPGKTITAYLQGHRKKYTSPVKFLLITVSVYVLVSVLAVDQTVDLLSETEDIRNTQQKMIDLMQKYMNLVLLGSIPLASLLSWPFFRKTRANYAENLATNAYLFAILNVFSLLSSLLYLLIGGGKSETAILVSGIVPALGYLYIVRGYMLAFRENTVWGALKGFLVLMIYFSLLGGMVLALLEFIPQLKQ